MKREIRQAKVLEEYTKANEEFLQKIKDTFMFLIPHAKAFCKGVEGETLEKRLEVWKNHVRSTGVFENLNQSLVTKALDMITVGELKATMLSEYPHKHQQV